MKKKRCPWCGDKCIGPYEYNFDENPRVYYTHRCPSCNKLFISQKTKKEKIIIGVLDICTLIFLFGFSTISPLTAVIFLIWFFVYWHIVFAVCQYFFSPIKPFPYEDDKNYAKKYKISAPYNAIINKPVSLSFTNIFLIRFSDIQLEKLVTHRDLIKDYRNGIPVYVEKRKDEDFYRFGMLKPEFIHNELIIPGTKFELIDDDVIAVGTVK